MLKVGLTGGTGAGKSTVAEALRARGAVVVDADAVAREVVAAGTPGLAEVVQAFGPAVLRPDGTLDRAALGEVVFADPARRAVLNAIVHPRVAERTAELVGAAPPDAIVVHDVPLLVENGLAPAYDVVVVVDAPAETQVRRLVRHRGLTEEQARARVAAQASREERRAVADVVLDGGGSIEDLHAQVARLWDDLRRRAAASPDAGEAATGPGGG